MPICQSKSPPAGLDQWAEVPPLQHKGDLCSAVQGTTFSCVWLSSGAGDQVKPWPKSWWVWDSLRSKPWGGGRPHHFCENPPLPVHLQKCGSMQMILQEAQHRLCTACWHDESLFVPALKPHIISTSSGVAAVWKTRPRFVQALWNAIRSPSTASRSWS